MFREYSGQGTTQRSFDLSWTSLTEIGEETKKGPYKNGPVIKARKKWPSKKSPVKKRPCKKKAP
jgi:hypothetical protein